MRQERRRLLTDSLALGVIWRRRLLLVALFLAVPLGLAAQDMVIDEHFGMSRYGVAHEQVPEEWRDEDKNRFIECEADFNGDGVDEFALFVHGQLPGRKTLELLVVTFESENNLVPTMIAELDFEELPVLGIRVVEPGTYKTICGNGYRPCSEGEPETVELTLPAIALFRHEGSKTVFYWDAKSRSYRRFEVNP